MLKNLQLATRTEWIKIKGLGLIYAGAGLALVMPLLKFTGKIFGPRIPGPPETSISLFEDALTSDTGPFAKFFIILFIVVATNRICQIDHKNGGWLLMETQPVKKLSIYLAKYLNIVFLSFLTIAFFFLFTILFTALNQWLFGQTEAKWALSFSWLLQDFLKLFVSSLGISGFMLFVSVVFQGYIWPFIIGILGLVLNLVSYIRKEFYPYSPMHTEQLAFSQDTRSLNTFFGFSEALSIFWTISFLLIGYLWYSRKSFKRAFIFDTKVRIRTLLMLLVLGSAYYFIQKPKQVAPLAATSLSGKLEGPDLPKELYLIEPEFNQKVATIPLVNGEFTWSSSEELPLGFYKLISDDRSINTGLFLGKGDFYNFEVFRGPSGDISFLKTNRKAEIGLQGMPFGFEISYFPQLFQDKPGEYYKEMNKAWERSLEKMKSFRTAENYTVADDFLLFKQQDMAVNFLKAAQGFYRNNSEEEKAYKALVTRLEKELEKPSELTLANPNYLAFKLSSFSQEGARADSATWAGVSALEKGRIKDKLLSYQIATSMEKLPDFQARQQLINRYSDAFSDPRYTEKLEQVLSEQQVTLKGLPFPDITIMDVDNDSKTIKDFKGKYVVIELWSKGADGSRQAFRDAAARYYWYRNVAFASVNVDFDEEGWKSYLKDRKEGQNLQEYWLPAGAAFVKEARIRKLPHYIVVDDKGLIHDFNASAPDRPEFHTLLGSIL